MNWYLLADVHTGTMNLNFVYLLGLLYQVGALLDFCALWTLVGILKNDFFGSWYVNIILLDDSPSHSTHVTGWSVPLILP